MVAERMKAATVGPAPRLGQRRRERIASNVAGIAVAVLLAAACSSSDDRPDTGTDVVSSEALATDDGVGAAEDPTVAALAEPSNGRGVRDSGTASPSPAASPRTVVAESARPPVLGRGVTESTISIGVQVNKPINYAAFGGGDAQSAEGLGPARAVVDYINANGGMAGRQVDAVYHETDVTIGSFEQQAQEVCAKFVEDNQVFAAIASPNGGDPAACYAQSDTVYVSNKRSYYDQEMLDEYANSLYLPGRMSGTRYGQAFVDGLADQGYFSGGAKVAILRYDTAPLERLSDNIIKPRLARHGVTVTEEIAITEPDGTTGLGNVSAQLGSAVLRMRTSGVDRVMFLDPGGAMVFLFQHEAESQQYHPRYGLNSDAAPQFQEPNQAGTQLHGAVGVGWVPSDDVNLSQDPGGRPTYELCIEVMKAKGFTFPDRASEVTALGTCDQLLFLKAVLDRAYDLTPAGFREAVETLGDAYTPAFTFTTSFGPRKHDGPSSVRYLAFDDACACFKYNGPLRPLT